MGVYVIDLEANGLLEELDKIHCAVASTLDGKKVVKFTPKNIHLLPKFLEEEVDIFIGHNIISYDLPVIKKVFGYEFNGKVVDTLLMSRLYSPNRIPPYAAKDRLAAIKSPHGLYSWGVRVGIDKPEINDWSCYTDEMLFRCEEDVRINVATYHILMKEMKAYNWLDATKLTFDLFRNLQKQSENGWKLDVGFCERTLNRIDRFKNWLDRNVEEELPYVVENLGTYKAVFNMNGTVKTPVRNYLGDCNVGGVFSKINVRKVNTASAKEVKEYLLESGWIPEAWNISKTTGERTSPKLSQTDAYVGIKTKAGKLLAKRTQVTHRESTIKGWLARVREDGRISCNVSGMASTGRMKHRDVANVPSVEAFLGKTLRACFTSEDDYVLVGCDSAGCQNRMLAGRVGDPEFTEILINGDKDKGTSIHQVNQKAIKEIAGISVSYKESKNLNYAFMFGASDNKLGSIINRSKEVGGEIRRALLSVTAGFQKLVENLQQEWRSNAKIRTNKWGKKEFYSGWVTGLDGRPIFIESEHTILVYVLQSDEAIMMSKAYNLLCERLKTRFKDGEYRVVCFYHDEYTVECKKEIAKEVAKIAEQCITDAGEYYKINCKHEGDASIGRSWYDIH